VQQIGNGVITDGVTGLLERRFQAARTAARPAQWRLRIPAHARLNQRLKPRHQFGLMFAQSFATPARNARALRLHTRIQICKPTVDGLTAHPGYPRDALHAAAPVTPRLRSSHQASLPFIHQRQDRGQFLSQRLNSDIHAPDKILNALHYV
jgi:hypothetical protein